MHIVENRWIGVDERMPDMVLKKYLDDGSDYLESDYVLVWDGHRVDIAQAISDETGHYWVDRCAGTVKAMFWMPLPTPPEQHDDCSKGTEENIKGYKYEMSKM